MTEWRLLVDENTDLVTATTLHDHGYDATTVQETVGKGTEDPDVRAYADQTDRVLVTTDRGFQRPERNRGITVLLVPGDLDGPAIAQRTVETIEYAETPGDLGNVVWLSEE